MDGAVIGLGDWPRLGAQVPGAVALLLPDRSTVTYAELDGASSRVARELRSRGLAKGDRLATLSTDTPDLVVLLLAALKLGVVVVPLNYRLTVDGLQAVLETARPRALAVGPRYVPMVDDLVDRMPEDRLTIGLDGAEDCDLDVTLAPGDASEASLPAATSDADVLLWILTSGTTRAPKLVAQSQRMIKANAVKGAIEHGFAPGETFYAGSPLFHAAGLGWLWYALSRGGTYLLMPQFDARTLAAALRDGVLTRCMLVPSMAIELLDLEAERGPFPGLRSISYGGAAATPALVERLHRAFACDLYNTFGAGTECGGQTVLRPEDHRRALAGEPHLLGSIGRPMYGVEIEIRDEAGVLVPEGTVGEIWSRSDTLMEEYVGREDLTAERLRGGWIRNSDLAWRDPEGYLFLVGRDDDVIIRGGEKINPLEVEAVLADHPHVAEAAVVGLPDDYWGHVVAAAVVPRPGVEPDLAGIEALVAARLPSFKRPGLVVAVDDLPRNASGKTTRPAVAERLARLRDS